MDSEALVTVMAAGAWIAFALYSSHVITDRVTSRARQRGSSVPVGREIQPTDRISHVVSDVGTADEHAAQFNTCYGLIGLPVFGFLVHEQYGQPFFGLAVWFFAGMGGWWLTPAAVRAQWRLYSRTKYRETVRCMLAAESHRWDPEGRNPKVFVIHRDNDPVAVDLFHAITISCYAIGLSVLQYTEIAWPKYHTITVPHSGRSHPDPVPHPEMVDRADIVVRLAFAADSDATRLEYARASKLDRPIVTVSRIDDTFIISEGPISEGPIARGEVPQVLAVRLAARVSRRDCASEDEVRSVGR